jgi:hypothetical protein
MWRLIRIALLLSVLVLVAGITLLDRLRTTDWDRPLRVGVFPIVADDSTVARDYVAELTREEFAGIEAFFEREARRAGLPLAAPVRVTLYPAVADRPPLRAPTAGAIATGFWSLRLRAWAWRVARHTPAQIRVFVLYHDPERSPVVPHSLGLQKGLIGVVHAFAAPQMDGANQIVIAHELLHTLGATDKYEAATLLPRWPDGYAAPNASPRYPQRDAEIMAGRRALSAREAEMPDSLDDVRVGAATAREIRWPSAIAQPVE